MEEVRAIRTVKLGTVILHSRADDVVPYVDSEELIKNSGLSTQALVEVGNDHRLADPEPLGAMLRACDEVTPLPNLSAFVVPYCPTSAEETPDADTDNQSATRTQNQ